MHTLSPRRGRKLSRDREGAGLGETKGAVAQTYSSSLELEVFHALRFWSL